jgi:hypothetical protein
MTISGLLSLWLIARPGAAAVPPEPAQSARSGHVAGASVSWSSQLKLASLADIDGALAQPVEEVPDAILDDDNSVRSIKTCNDLLAVAKLKFHLAQENKLVWDGFIDEALRCFALDTLRGARPAATSFLGWFRLSRSGVARLPARFAPVLSDADEKNLARAKVDKRCRRWGKYDHRLRLQAESPDQAWVGGDGWAGRLSLYARGDFDGDGREDLMLLRYGKVDEGTVSDTSLFIVTQTSRRGCPRIVRALPRSLGNDWGS